MLVYLHVELELDAVVGGEVGREHRRDQSSLYLVYGLVLVKVWYRPV